MTDKYYPTQCPCCDSWTHDVERRLMNTAYVNEESNWLLSCLACYEVSEKNWADQWRDYYSGRL